MAARIQTFEGEGQLIGNALAQPQEGGAFARDAAATFGALAGELHGMAVDAAQREGAAAGLKAGQEASLPAAPPTAAGVPVASINGSFVDRLIKIESGGVANARNPASSATGAGQFVKGTWLDMIGRYRPDLAKGKSEAEVLALRNDAALSREMVAYLASENASALEASGIDTTEGNLYLAHFLGAGGARAVLSADPSTPVSSLLDGSAVAANGSVLAGKTAGQVAAWAARKMGGAQAGSGAGGEAAPITTGESRSGPALQLRNDGTAYGNAYDEAALRAHGWRLEAGLHADLGNAYEELKDDPRALQQRFAEIRKNYLDDSGVAADPRMREVLDKSFSDKSLAYTADARQRTEARRLAEQSAAAGDLIEAQRSDIERQAFIAGGKPNADAALGTLVAQGVTKIDGMVASRAISPAEGAAQKRQLILDASGARIRGEFSTLPDLAARERYAAGLMDAWKNGTGAVASLDFRQVSALKNSLDAAISEEKAAKTADTVLRKHQLEQAVDDDVASIANAGTGILSDGKPLDAGEIGAILGPEKALDWLDKRAGAKQLYDATNGMKSQTEADIRGRLADLEPKPGEAGYAQRKETFDKATTAANKILADRKADPAAASDAAFPKVAAAAKEFGQSANPQTLSALVQSRAAAQAALGVSAPDQRYLSASEAKAFRTAIEASPDNAAAWTVEIAKLPKTIGDGVLSQVADDAPALAVAAGIAIEGGTPETLRRLTQQQAIEREAGYRPPELKRAQAAGIASETFGPAFTLYPAQQSARVTLAEKLFLSLARERGTSTDIGSPDGEATWREALQMAAGARFSGGAQFGGMTDVNGAATLVPPDMPAEAVPQIFNNLTDEDLAALGAPVSGNGVPIRAADIRSARLVPAGDGVYRIAQDDPDGVGPRYAATSDGSFWTLDIRRLSAIQTGRTLSRLSRNPFAGGIRNPVTGQMR